MRLGKPVQEKILADIAKLEGAGSKRPTVLALAGRHGVSERQVYRLWQQHEPSRRRAQPGSGLDPEALAQVLTLQVQLDLATDHAREIVENHRGEALPSGGTLNRMRRQAFQLTRRKMRRMIRPSGQVKSLDCVRLRAQKSNQVWQLDFTRAEQYYIDEAGAVGVLSPLTHSKNKDGKPVRPLWLYSVTDDHSGASFGWFYDALNGVNVIDFLVKAMTPKTAAHLAHQAGAPPWLVNDCIAATPSEDRLEWFCPERFPLCGVPEMILTDNDAVFKSEKTVVKSAIERRLQVKFMHHVAGHSNVKGKVESRFWVLAEFQKVTKAGKFRSLFEANVALMDFQIRENQRRNAFQTWLGGLNGNFRVLDQEELIHRIYLDEIEAVIDNECAISYHGRRIHLPREDFLRHRVGDRCRFYVPVRYQPGDEVAILIDDTERWLTPVEPIVLDTGKQFRALPDTANQRLVKELLATDISHMQLTGFYHDRPENRREYELPLGESYRPETLQPVKGAPRSLLYAVKRFQEEGMFARPVTESEKAWLKSALFVHREEVYDAELEDFVRSVKRGDLSVGDNVAMFAGEK